MTKLTRELIEGMKPGSNLDQLICSNFGFEYEEWYGVKGARWYILFKPSTSIADAFKVVDKMQSIGLRVEINTTCDAGLFDVSIGDSARDFFAVVFTSLPLAICRASLLATINNPADKSGKE